MEEREGEEGLYRSWCAKRGRESRMFDWCKNQTRPLDLVVRWTVGLRSLTDDVLGVWRCGAQMMAWFASRKWFALFFLVYFSLFFFLSCFFFLGFLGTASEARRGVTASTLDRMWCGSHMSTTSVGPTNKRFGISKT